MKPNDPWDPLDLAPPRPPRLHPSYVALLILLGCLFLWLLLSRSNAPEEGGIREIGAVSDAR
jgi:hypothetical protein